MSEEERLRRIREMEQDALTHDALRMQKCHHTKYDKQTDLEDKEMKRKSTDAKFLTDLRVGVYNNDNATMEDRLKRNRHYHQRTSDLDSQGFLTK
mmetsp:Transcript_30573/g.31113  ORF Transcript_30573/g.31113 Transcript_30573/m.31113 type:complete len:95 (-) Transcript_30573:13-297(-)